MIKLPEITHFERGALINFRRTSGQSNSGSFPHGIAHSACRDLREKGRSSHTALLRPLRPTFWRTNQRAGTSP
jgi:hypothetical protein